MKHLYVLLARGTARFGLRAGLLLGLCLCAFSFVRSPAPFDLGLSVAAAEGGGGNWEHVEEDDGINLWKLEVPGKDLPGFRGQAFIKGSLDAGWVSYFPPYERVHRTNLERVSS